MNLMRDEATDISVYIVPVETNGSVPELNHTSETTMNGSATELNTSATISTQMLNVSDAVNNSNKVNDSKAEPDIVLPTIMVNNTSLNITTGVLDDKNGTGTSRRLLEASDSKQSQEDGSRSKADGSGDAHVATVENDEALEADADSSFEIFRENDELADEYNYDYDDYVDESMWGDEEWTEVKHEKVEEYVDIDAHILCTPVSLTFILQINLCAIPTIHTTDCNDL